MVYNRTGYAPWSLTREAGVQSATVDGTIEVPQYIQPTIDTGFCDEKGNWKGIKSSDEVFVIDETHAGVPDNGAVLVPQAQPDRIDMTGFNDLYIAIMGTRTGNCMISAVMGPDTNTFANLTPVNAAADLKYLSDGLTTTFQNLLSDSSEALTADVWNIFSLNRRGFAGQKNLQFKITNTAGGNSDITFAYLRVV